MTHEPLHRRNVVPATPVERAARRHLESEMRRDLLELALSLDEVSREWDCLSDEDLRAALHGAAMQLRRVAEAADSATPPCPDTLTGVDIRDLDHPGVRLVNPETGRGERLAPRRVRVWLDGYLLCDWAAASTEGGWALVYERDAAGSRAPDPASVYGYRVRRREGAVSIGYRW